VIARAAAGASQRAIAQEFSIAERTVRAVLERARKAPSGLNAPPMSIVEDALRIMLRQRADLLALAWAQQDRNPHVALGALRVAGETLDRYLTLLGDVGKLPTDIELFQSELALRSIAERLVEKLHDVERGEYELSDVIAFFDGLLNREEDPR
jgi:hypothetical protein